MRISHFDWFFLPREKKARTYRKWKSKAYIYLFHFDRLVSTLLFHRQCGTVKTCKVMGFCKVHGAPSPADGELGVKNLNTLGEKNHTESLEQKQTVING